MKMTKVNPRLLKREQYMAGEDLGSLTKEPPLATLDATIRAVTPGMPYQELLAFARVNTHRDAPGLIRKRFLLVNTDDTITYDHFLSVAAVQPLEGAIVRKVMYFLWAYRDDRIRRFICEKIANKNGQWRIPELLKKANASFFEQWLQESTARKARSNFEYFLYETKIYDPDLQTIHLELDDGWLEQAAIAAAQHERDPIVREELLTNPIKFLENRNWLGLLNISDTHLPPSSPLLSTTSVPREDDQIHLEPSSSPTSSVWDRKAPTTSGKKAAVSNIDLVARERASKSHFMLEKILADHAKRNGYMPRYNQNIDMHFDTPDGTVLAEMKSCTDSNFHSQLRKGISQLFEYRFLFKDLFTSKITMLLLMESAPPKRKKWLVDYVASLGVVLAWKHSCRVSISTTCSLPRTLVGIVDQIEK